ncbi:hypothetical protein [Shimia sp.]|uniref:hypothetical protein n=1 Tax=Shimia sp. TaxID=1954381 RepID=UPI00329713D7
MSGTKSHSLKAPVTEIDTNEGPYWSVQRLSIWFFPFAWGAVAINLFLIGLMWQAIDLPVIAPVAAILLSFPLAFPATWACARWIRGLMDEAEG